MIWSMWLPSAVLAAGAGGGVRAVYPLPGAVVASGAISAAIERFARTGEFRLELGPDTLDPPGTGTDCISDYHPLENTLWEYRVPRTPQCPGYQAAAQCVAEWFTRWRQELTSVHNAWQDAYCYCHCCPEEAGFENSEDCVAAMIEVFQPEFQKLIDAYNAFDPNKCCPVVR